MCVPEGLTVLFSLASFISYDTDAAKQSRTGNSLERSAKALISITISLTKPTLECINKKKW